MLDYSIISVFSSITVIIIILWSLTMLGSFFFNSGDLGVKFDSYECGFKSFTDLKISVSVGNYIVILFIVFYDIELLLTIPFLLFFDPACLFNINHIYFLFLAILITFLIDILDGIISWDF